MKNFKRIVTVSSFLLIVANTVYATSEEAATADTNYTKYILMGVAALVIVLLLFLGYKMDSKGSELDIPKPPKKVDKSEMKDVKYEQDEASYEDDPSITVDDLDEITEYEDDEEESLFSNSNGDDIELSHSGMSTNNNVSNAVKPEPPKPVAPPVEEPEATGEEFDTSIIDSIEDDDSLSSMGSNDVVEDDFEMPLDSEPMEVPGVSDISELTGASDAIDIDGTMVFDNSKILGSALDDEMDNLDNEIDIGSDTSDPLIDSLKNFKEPESTFGGFSVSDPNEEIDISEEPAVKPKKYTKTKEVIEDKPEEITSIASDKGFLEQMERNLQKNKEERDAKKSTKKTTTKKKE